MGIPKGWRKFEPRSEAKFIRFTEEEETITQRLADRHTGGNFAEYLRKAALAFQKPEFGGLAYLAFQPDPKPEGPQGRVPRSTPRKSKRK